MSTITGIGQDVTPADTTSPATSTETTTTTATNGTGRTTGTNGTTGTGKTGTGSEFGLDKDAFLKILVEQLRHQDPAKPGDSQEYVQQMTQYSMLEQLTNISESVQVQHADNAGNTAIGLVGRTVTYTDEDDVEQSGVVTGVEFTSEGPTLTVGEKAGVQLGAIKEVR